MNHPSLKSLMMAGVLLGGLVGSVAAQENLPFGPSNYEHDMQLFSPLQMDLDNSTEDQWSGYYFNYDKLFWSYSGERVTVGDPNVVVLAEQIYLQNPQDQGIRPEPYQVRNGLEDVPPKAGFAMGNRYEIGYRDQIRVTVYHQFALLPGPGRLLARRANESVGPDTVSPRIQPRASNLYTIQLSATATMVGEGEKSARPYVHRDL